MKLPIPAKYLLLAGGFFSVLLFVCLVMQNAALVKIDSVPFTAYNHSNSMEEANQVMASWRQNPAAGRAVNQIIYSDYVFMLLYGVTIFYALLAGYANSKTGRKFLFAAGMILIIAGVAADVVQDHNIQAHLMGKGHRDLRGITYIKFGCIAGSLLILLTGIKTILKRPAATGGSEAISVEDFTGQPEVAACIKQLEAKYGAGGKNLIVSDVIDGEGHQYVNLVQKGGGVLGVALVGYTYILEQMNIRFIRLAGTSAGAINTGLMTVIGAQKSDGLNNNSKVLGNKKLAKSKEILKAICDLNFFSLVDGHPAARTLIKRFITNKDFTANLEKWATVAAITFLLLLAVDAASLGLQHRFIMLSMVTKLFFILAGFYILLLVIAISYASYLLKRLRESGFGINPGNFFYDWIKQQFEKNHVRSVSDLQSVASTPVDDLSLREKNVMGLSELEGDVTFITSEMVTENKIEFPKMWDLFREKTDELSPAGFIRASMSIPVFFESYFIDEIPCTAPAVRKAWWDRFGEADPPTTARFVDGGILSNFPINLFYNPKVDRPRLPSFGIDLDDEMAADEEVQANKTKDAESETDDESKNAGKWSFGGYLYRMFNTVRFYYDKDFLIKNRFFQKGIGKIPLKGFNWLNFFLSNEDKQKMFVLGAKAATRFLLNDDGNGFNWNDYKEKRFEMHEDLKNQ